ncbi:MAG: Nre family DNA repair protein [Candidatus Diapherotrites archaeon]
MISGGQCIKCKGRLFCGLKSCPVLERFNSLKKISFLTRAKSFSGNSPPSLFVSWKNYPDISIAPLTPPQLMHESSLLDKPEQWYGMQQEQIIEMRSLLVSPFTKTQIESASRPDRKLSELQEMVMSEKPVELSIELKKEIRPTLSFDSFVAPIGPSAPLKKFSLNENPKIPKKVDYIVSDTDLKSTNALQELYESDFAVSYLQKILSAGLLGRKRERKMVPTRWAITAVDSNLSSKMLKEIKYSPQIESIELFESIYLDNHFIILLIPSSWMFEQLEAWLPQGIWTQKEVKPQIIADYELFKGRKDYASNVTGAYYSSRLAVCEYLQKKKRQAAAVIFREIGSGYAVPMGVWVIRETVRRAFKKKPAVFYDLNLALNYAEKKLHISLAEYKKESKVLKEIQSQKKLSEF